MKLLKDNHKSQAYNNSLHIYKFLRSCPTTEIPPPLKLLSVHCILFQSYYYCDM
jgi:hypothetical protein